MAALSFASHLVSFLLYSLVFSSQILGRLCVLDQEVS
jgi:hypothetical protein